MSLFLEFYIKVLAIYTSIGISCYICVVYYWSILFYFFFFQQQQQCQGFNPKKLESVVWTNISISIVVQMESFVPSIHSLVYFAAYHRNSPIISFLIDSSITTCCALPLMTFKIFLPNIMFILIILSFFLHTSSTSLDVRSSILTPTLFQFLPYLEHPNL